MTSKLLTDWLDDLNDGMLMVAVHTNESGFPAMAIHGHISRLVPEPSTGLSLAAGLFWPAPEVPMSGTSNNIGMNYDASTPSSVACPGDRLADRHIFGAGVSGPAVRYRRMVQRDHLGQHAADGHRSDPHQHAPDRQGAVLANLAGKRRTVGSGYRCFSAPAIPSYNVFCSGHTFLADGRLFVAGGHVENYNGEHRADIYNPFTNTWSNMDPGMPDVPTMGPASDQYCRPSGKRWYPSATTLGNGNVLVLSGDVVSQGVTNRRVQIYNAGTNSWTELTGALRTDLDPGPGVNIDGLPEYPRVFQLPDGRAVSLSDNSNDTEFLNMSGTGSWTYLQDTLDPNLHNYGPAVMYDTGKVAYIGGGHVPTKNISMIDFNDANPSWRYGGGGTTPPPDGSPYAMDLPRRQNNATILADGTVLITGGSSITEWNDPDGRVSVAEIWDPETEFVTQVAEANESIYRGYHSTALLLPDGRVLVTGGDHDTGGFQQPQCRNLFAGLFVQGPAADNHRRAGGCRIGAHDLCRDARCGGCHESAVGRTGLGDPCPKLVAACEPSGVHPGRWRPGYYIAGQRERGSARLLYALSGERRCVPSVAEWVRAVASTGLPGDFNQDGAVNAADYVVCQRAWALPIRSRLHRMARALRRNGLSGQRFRRAGTRQYSQSPS